MRERTHHPADAAADTSTTDAAVPDAADPDSGSTCPVPVAHWELDESGGTIAVDRISSENAVVVGAVTLNAAAGVVGGAAEFGGAGAINASFIDNLPTGDFTWAAWVRPDDLGNRYLLSIRASDNSISYLKWTNESDAEFVLNDVLVLDGAAGFSSDSTWQHVAVVRAGSAVTLYRNRHPHRHRHQWNAHRFRLVCVSHRRGKQLHRHRWLPTLGWFDRRRSHLRSSHSAGGDYAAGLTRPVPVSW